MKKLTFVIYRVANNVIVFDELLLLSDHIFQIDDDPRLKLQIEQQLDILGLKETVLNNHLQEVSDVLHIDPIFN